MIPSLVFFLCLFSAAFTPKDTPSVDASVMKKWVEDNRKTDSYMVHLSGGSVKKKKQAIPDTKQDRHVYVMSSDHGNSDCGGTGDNGSETKQDRHVYV